MMTVFPQLSSGAVGQFPFDREIRFRTLVNRAADGTEIRVSDVDFQERLWRLPVSELSDQEWQQIEDLLVQVEGRLKSFLFLEPGASLLSWSELFSDPAWQKDSGISVLGGQPDPFGGTEAGRVTSGGSQGALSQLVNIPGSFRYAGSLWARTSQPGAVLQIDDAGAQAVEAGIDTSNQWKRYSAGYNLSSSSETIRYRVVLPAGAVVEIYGPQLEAQPAPSAYKRTLQQSGIYPNARFDQDFLPDRLTGVNRHAGEIRISWTPSQI